MSGEMVERVAEALMRVTYGHDCGDLRRKHHYDMARAAIGVMREPVVPMILAACAAANAEQIRPVAVRRADVGLMWSAMIDAALVG